MKLQALFVTVPVLFAAVGCNSQPPQPTSEEKKAFMGGPMPKDFMEKNVKGHAGPPTGGVPKGESGTTPSANGQG